METRPYPFILGMPLVEIMSGVIKARYENKVLNPLGEIDLKDGEEVEIRVGVSATSRVFGIVKCWEGLEEAHEEYEKEFLTF